jgi:hypothetical protein
MKTIQEELVKVRAKIEDARTRDIERWRNDLHAAVDAYGDARASEEELRIMRGKYEPLAARLVQARREVVTKLIEEVER